MLALLIGGFAGLSVAIARVQPSRLLRLLAAGFIELFQDTPLLLQLFVAFFGLGIIGINVDAWTAATIALSLHTAAFLGEIWRGSIQAVPSTQWEASRALSLSWLQTLRLVILPQAIRTSIAPTVGFLVQLVKNTSIVSVVGFVELSRAGALVNNATFRPFQVFTVVAALYFAICFPLSRYSRHLERAMNASRGH